MPRKAKCRVPGCPTNSLTSIAVSFHRIPVHPITRNAWIQILGLCEKTEKFKSLKVCARHFDDEDYQMDRSGNKLCLKNLITPKRYLPEELASKVEAAQQYMYHELFNANSDDEGIMDKDPLTENESCSKETEESIVIKEEVIIKEEPNSDCDDALDFVNLTVQKKLMVDGATQTDLIPKDRSIITFEKLQARQIMYFTEFSHDQFNALYNFLMKSKSIPPDALNAFTSISTADQLLLTLYKYRLNHDFKMIGALFNVTHPIASKIFKHWSLIINMCLHDIDFWSLGKTDGSAKYRVCLHCVRVPRDSDSSSSKRESRNKNTTDAKFKCLIGINEGGIVIFCSKLFRHDVSLRQMFISSNLLGTLTEGETILTSMDFKISDLLKGKNVALNIVPFILDFDSAVTKVSIESKPLANRKIHTDRLINLLNIYKILSDPIENELLSTFSDIIYNCVMLCNFKPKKK